MLKTANTFNSNILQWFDKNGRKNLPWQTDDSYHVWISEIMLQQTQVNKVIDYFNNFISKFPTLNLLAQSKSDDVLSHWSGLGYYNRARNIHKTAQICAQQYNNKLPLDLKQLMALPGIGQTTAGAILSLAANLPFPILDGNVKRVISRVYRISAEKPSTLNNKLWKTVSKMVPKDKPRDFNQALMDLGSIICTHKKPKCGLCPMIKNCRAYKSNTIDLYPQAKVKVRQVDKSYYLFMLICNDEIYLQQRDSKNIWPQLWFLPMFESQRDLCESKEYKLLKKPQVNQFEIKHILTHRKLSLYVSYVHIKAPNKSDKSWIKLSDYKQLPHPTALVKIIEHYYKVIDAII